MMIAVTALRPAAPKSKLIPKISTPPFLLKIGDGYLT
jgi:hypothetical protein